MTDAADKISKIIYKEWSKWAMSMLVAQTLEEFSLKIYDCDETKISCEQLNEREKEIDEEISRRINVMYDNILTKLTKDIIKG